MDEEILIILEETEAIVFDGFERALVGYTCGYGPTRAVYEWGKCIEILMRRDGMSYEDAEEFFEFNVAGSHLGEKTPEIVNTGYYPRKVPQGYLPVWEKS